MKTSMLSKCYILLFDCFLLFRIISLFCLILDFGSALCMRNSARGATLFGMADKCQPPATSLSNEFLIILILGGNRQQAKNLQIELSFVGVRDEQ